MSKKYGTLCSDFLAILSEGTGLFSWPPKDTVAYRLKQIYGSRRNFLNKASYLKQRGMIKAVSREGKKFLQLTSKGELELLIQKAMVDKGGKWDNKWRIIIFDIPESANKKRDFLRRLLKRNQFLKLQASVFISPYPLNREAIVYLKQTGLISFIRFIKAEEIDDDSDLRRKFRIT